MSEASLQLPTKDLHLLKRLLAGFTADPGTSDLDDEQPIHLSILLGDWRKLNGLIHRAEGR